MVGFFAEGDLKDWGGLNLKHGLVCVILFV